MAQGQNTQAIGGFVSSIVQQYADARTKPGFKTSEFWLSTLVAAVSLLPGLVPPQWGPVVAMVTTLGYTLSRMFVKRSLPTPIATDAPVPVLNNAVGPDKAYQPGRM